MLKSQAVIAFLLLAFGLKGQVVETIAFGSCNKHTESQPLWLDIIDTHPDLWIWLGDNIYADTGDTALVNKMYDIQSQHPKYSELVESTEVIGIWDDHDYGVNNGGKHFLYKDATKAAMLDFLNVPADAAVRSRSGAYQSYVVGQGVLSVKVILLDVRYFRDDISRKNRAYVPNQTGTMLGEEQWRWFEAQMQDDSIDLFIIGSGIQIIPEDHPYEKWANFPEERRRLLNLVTGEEIPGVILLTGDRHIGEISVMQFRDARFPLVEVTSSGLTHAYTGNTDEPNRHRHGNIADQLNFGVLHLETDENSLVVRAEIRGRGGDVLESINISYPH